MGGTEHGGCSYTVGERKGTPSNVCLVVSRRSCLAQSLDAFSCESVIWKSTVLIKVCTPLQTDN